MKDRFVLPTFRSECSDLLQGEDETSMRHLSLYNAELLIVNPAAAIFAQESLQYVVLKLI